MLVLSRKKNEVVKITVPPSTEPRVIEVLVCRVHPQPRLGFTADRDVIIVRKEIEDQPAKPVVQIEEQVPE